MTDFTPRQIRMLKAGTFHFDSGGDNRANPSARGIESTLFPGPKATRQGVVTAVDEFMPEHTDEEKELRP